MSAGFDVVMLAMAPPTPTIVLMPLSTLPMITPFAHVAGQWECMTSYYCSQNIRKVLSN